MELDGDEPVVAVECVTVPWWFPAGAVAVGPDDDGNDVMSESLSSGIRHVPIAIRAAGDAPGTRVAMFTPVSSQISVLLGTTTEYEPLIARDAALAGWLSSRHEFAP
jgi:hypothetical protein